MRIAIGREAKGLLLIPPSDKQSTEHDFYVEIANLIADVGKYSAKNGADHRFHASFRSRSAPTRENKPFLDALLAYTQMEKTARDCLLEWIGSVLTSASTVYPKTSDLIARDAAATTGSPIQNRELKGAMLICGHAPIRTSEAQEDWRFRIRLRIKTRAPKDGPRPKQARGFGQTLGMMIRQARESRGLSLREFAKMAGISPAYLSKVELNQFGPPATEKLLGMAEILDINSDLLLARAGKIAPDVLQAICRNPTAVAELVRATAPLSAKQILRAAEDLSRQHPRKGNSLDHS
jgi:transcriptional regulator with XRE-family HTH domain